MAVDVANQNDASRISKDALAKAQRMAAIQAQIQQQMQNLQAVPGAGAGFGMLGSAMVGIPGIAAPGLMMAKKETFMPAPLILDDKGRHVDSSGKEVVQKAEAVATLKANQVQRYLRNDMCVCMQRAILGLVAVNCGSCLPLRAEQGLVCGGAFPGRSRRDSEECVCVRACACVRVRVRACVFCVRARSPEGIAGHSDGGARAD